MTFSLKHLETLRHAELEKAASLMGSKERILEIGAGTGQQARQLTELGHEVIAIDVPDSSYSANQIFPVQPYNGTTIPLPGKSVDVVFSSNVLEHVQDLPGIHCEILRVLRPGGYCIHILPTHVWRFWSLLMAYPDAAAYLIRNFSELLPRPWRGSEDLKRLRMAWANAARACANILPIRHGERGNAISELWLFHPAWWRRNFRSNGFDIVHEEPMGLFYTGNMLLGAELSLNSRARLAQVLGSACHLFKVSARR
jgi:SAM-dependent methyltransferase